VQSHCFVCCDVLVSRRRRVCLSSLKQQRQRCRGRQQGQQVWLLLTNVYWMICPNFFLRQIGRHIFLKLTKLMDLPLLHQQIQCCTKEHMRTSRFSEIQQSDKVRIIGLVLGFSVILTSLCLENEIAVFQLAWGIEMRVLKRQLFCNYIGKRNSNVHFRFPYWPYSHVLGRLNFHFRFPFSYDTDKRNLNFYFLFRCPTTLENGIPISINCKVNPANTQYTEGWPRLYTNSRELTQTRRRRLTRTSQNKSFN